MACKSFAPLTEKPLVAIGGIDQLNARQVLEAGADSVAVISALIPDKCDKKALRRNAEEWIRLLAVPIPSQNRSVVP